jgi:hypothetical protein
VEWVVSEGNESPVAKVTRTMIKMFNKLKGELKHTKTTHWIPREHGWKSQEETETTKGTQRGF